MAWLGALVLLLLQTGDSIWSTRAPLPERNSEIAVAGLDGRIYVLGGYPSSRV